MTSNPRNLLTFLFGITLILTATPALAQGVEFYLQDDGSFDKDNPQDFLVEGEPMVQIFDPINPPDLDNDGSPGLTIAKEPNEFDPLHFQEWVSDPQPERCFSGFGRVHLFHSAQGFRCQGIQRSERLCVGTEMVTKP